MAMVQLKCPQTGKPVNIGDVSPDVAFREMTADMRVQGIPCPHCGEDHRWSSSHFALAMEALRNSPEASRVLVDGGSATALS